MNSIAKKYVYYDILKISDLEAKMQINHQKFSVPNVKDFILFSFPQKKSETVVLLEVSF